GAVAVALDEARLVRYGKDRAVWPLVVKAPFARAERLDRGNVRIDVVATHFELESAGICRRIAAGEDPIAVPNQVVKTRCIRLDDSSPETVVGERHPVVVTTRAPELVVG